MVRVRIPRSEVADGDWMETAWVLRHEFPDTFEADDHRDPGPPAPRRRGRRRPVVEAAEPGVPRLDEDDEESAI